MPGRTHLKSVHVPLPNGFVRTVQVYDKVNVATDPHLREPALAGALHRFETGEELAVPFVYHDPNARKLALVVPEVLRHQELQLRADLIEELAGHTGAAIPSYVREAKVVVGVPELTAYLESPDASAALGEVVQREQALEQRARDVEIQGEALTQREARLQQRAEQVTRREDELRVYGEELEAAQADLAMRERELESRLEVLRQREAEVAKRAEAAQPPSAETEAGQAPAQDVVELVDDEVEEVRDVQPAEELEAIEEVGDDEAIEELEELEPLETSPGESPADLSDAVELVGEAEPLEDEVEEIVEDVEELEEVEPVEEITGVHADAALADDPQPLEAQKTVIGSEIPTARSEPPPTPSAPAEPEGPPPPMPTVPPPAGFLERRHGPRAEAVPEAGGIRIFVRAAEGRDDLFAETAPRMLAQLVVVEECPVVLLTLVEEGEKRPTIVRAPVDPRSTDGREVLETLSRKYDARVVVFDGEGTYRHSLEVEGACEPNVTRILERVSKMRTAAAVDVPTAIERVLSAPPPVEAKDHPFRPADRIEPPANAAEAAERLGELAEWSSHDKLDHALLVLCLPPADVDATIEKTVSHAVEHGLPLPGRLAERALALGVASDEASLVARQIEALRETSELDDRGGLDEETLAEAWERLLERATETEVAIDTDTHAVAWSAIRAVRGGDQLEEIDPAEMPDMAAEELERLLDHPKYRRGAAIELAGRKDAELAERLCKAARKMPRSEVVRVVPRIAEMGDGAGDALIDGLSARKTFVRQAFALTLGHLKLRRAVVPLVHLLASEESDVWKEVARVVGSFGTASMRNVTRQLKDPKGLEERYVQTLAHLANHGCQKQVDKLSGDDRPKVAAMATEALTLRDQAKSIDDQVRGAVDLKTDDPILKFSRRFYEELEGKAPEGDLDED
ncbi:MAG TPA: hypothetical protein RMH99_22800 [Sandaracinaceae bacterium LLY-WYZ-13_1]|nr:hypothetical protein [Sandaracinaceae bacterium LLY-WYZ-13_1]